MRQAKSSGPQLVSEDGWDAVTIIAAAEFAKFVRPDLPFADFQDSLETGDIDLARDLDTVCTDWML